MDFHAAAHKPRRSGEAGGQAAEEGGVEANHPRVARQEYHVRRRGSGTAGHRRRHRLPVGGGGGVGWCRHRRRRHTRDGRHAAAVADRAPAHGRHTRRRTAGWRYRDTHRLPPPAGRRVRHDALPHGRQGHRVERVCPPLRRGSRHPHQRGATFTAIGGAVGSGGRQWASAGCCGGSGSSSSGGGGGDAARRSPQPWPLDHPPTLNGRRQRRRGGRRGPPARRSGCHSRQRHRTAAAADNAHRRSGRRRRRGIGRRHG